MADGVTGLEGRAIDGLVRVELSGPRGMITLRGDLSSSAIKNAATGVSGVDFPGQRECNCVDERGIGWMSPDELLVMVPYADIPKALQMIETTLEAEHALAADVSDARSLFTISGSQSRDVLAKLAPVDLSPAAFKPGEFRRTRLAQVPAAFWMRDNDTFELICFRSVSEYVSGLLTTAARPSTSPNFF